ncbi:C4-dicarboxylate ABC transporter [Alkalibacterium sp. f15]|uniref:C4-dicarboxylate ABC transporter n=1 Tax=Alkalibacterium sp. f15 TaxID=3414029 RepID=UPI003BF8FEAF
MLESSKVGKLIGWTAMALALIGFFLWQLPLGIIAIVLGLVGLATPEKGLNWTAIAFGAIAMIIGII